MDEKWGRSPAGSVLLLVASFWVGCEEEPEPLPPEVREAPEPPSAQPAPAAVDPAVPPARAAQGPDELLSELEDYLATVFEVAESLPETDDISGLPECEGGNPNDGMARGISVYEPWVRRFADVEGERPTCPGEDDPWAAALLSPHLCRAAELVDQRTGDEAALRLLHRDLVGGPPRLVLLRARELEMPVVGERRGNVTEFSPGRIVATAFVADRATGEVLCRARVAATNSPSLRDDAFGDPLRGDLMVHFRQALRAATPPVPSAVGGLSASVTAHDMLPVGPLPVTVRARRIGDRFDVRVEHLPRPCTPQPRFDAELAGSQLVLTVQRPDGPSRCVGLHSMTVDVAPVPPTTPVQSLFIELADGRRVARATVAP